MQLRAVAPFTGAWIEIIVAFAWSWASCKSLPSRGRGLKSKCLRLCISNHKSLPSRGRGLKLLLEDGTKVTIGRSLHGGVDWNTDTVKLRTSEPPVAPFTGAWIEIGNGEGAAGPTPVAPFTGAWIEMTAKQAVSSNHCRSLHGGVDWNTSTRWQTLKRKRRSLHGGVDWNQLLPWPRTYQPVAPFTGAWIEIKPRLFPAIEKACRSLHGGVDWNITEL